MFSCVNAVVGFQSECHETTDVPPHVVLCRPSVSSFLPLYTVSMYYVLLPKCLVS